MCCELNFKILETITCAISAVLYGHYENVEIKCSYLNGGTERMILTRQLSNIDKCRQLS